MARSTRAEWRRRVAEWSAGGLTCREYAAKKGVRPSTLAWWKWKLASEGERLDDPVPLMEVTALVASAGAETGRAAPLELLVAGIQVRVPAGFDGETLAQLLDVLETRR